MCLLCYFAFAKSLFSIKNYHRAVTMKNYCSFYVCLLEFNILINPLKSKKPNS